MSEAKSLDGPPGYPIVGNLFSISPANLHHVATEWSLTYGHVFACHVFSRKLVFLTSSKVIHEAFSSACSECVSQRTTTFFGNYVLDKSIAMSTDVRCAARLRPQLDSLITGSLEPADAGARYMAETFAGYQSLGMGKDMDVSRLLRKNLQDCFSKQLIGAVIPEGDPDKDILWNFIDSLYVMIDPSVDGPLKMFPFLRHLPGYYGDVFRQTIAARDKVGKRMFEDQKATYMPGRVRGLVDVCIKAQQDDTTQPGASWLTDDYIKGLIYDTLAAGMTELMKSLRLFMLLMCHHPEVQTKLQAEIDSVIGTERFPGGGDRQWMPYTQAVMLELWRYGSQTPLAIPHLCSRDVIVDDYLIEKGSLVLEITMEIGKLASVRESYHGKPFGTRLPREAVFMIFPNLYGVHHDETIWGDPWTFRPERFLDPAGTLLSRDHVFMQNVIPFSLGKRACPGQDFARSRIFIGMTSLLQRVRIEPPEKSVLPSADPRLYTKNYPLTEPNFECRFVSRENIIL